MFKIEFVPRGVGGILRHECRRHERDDEPRDRGDAVGEPRDCAGEGRGHVDHVQPGGDQEAVQGEGWKNRWPQVLVLGGGHSTVHKGLKKFVRY